jgi:hypothetical protein
MPGNSRRHNRCEAMKLFKLVTSDEQAPYSVGGGRLASAAAHADITPTLDAALEQAFGGVELARPDELAEVNRLRSTR